MVPAWEEHCPGNPGPGFHPGFATDFRNKPCRLRPLIRGIEERLAGPKVSTRCPHPCFPATSCLVLSSGSPPQRGPSLTIQATAAPPLSSRAVSTVSPCLLSPSDRFLFGYFSTCLLTASLNRIKVPEGQGACPSFLCCSLLFPEPGPSERMLD